MNAKAHPKLVVPGHLRRGGAGQKHQTTAADSGLELLNLMRERLQLSDYTNSSILDVG
jgi:hypothetical protein